MADTMTIFSSAAIAGRTLMSESLNLYQKLNTIRSKVAYLKKDKKVENYNAVSYDGLVAETRQWFIELGVMIIPSVVLDTTIDTGAKSQKGNTLWRYEGTFDITFVNCDDPSQTLTARVTAHANDYGDKAPGKAITYATKSAVLKVLYLETGENDEARIANNMTPGDEVEGEDLKVILDAITKSEDEKALLESFAAGIARTEKDKDAQSQVIQAKTARQYVLKHTPKIGGAK